MDRYRIIGSQSADGSPVLVHLEKSTFEFQLFKDESGGQIDLTGYTAEAAVNNTFDHTQNELMAYASGENCVVTDAEHGIIQVTLDCNTVKFGQVVRFRAQNAMLELNLIDQSGEAKRFALLSVKCMPRVRDQEGSPSPGDPRYLNAAEVNALINEREFAPSGGEVGDVLTKTATGQEWANGLRFTPYGLTLQYSTNGTSWHTTAATADKYIRFSTDNGTTWSNALLFKGVSTYTYTAYASDSSGNDFSLTRSSDLDYWNWIYSESPIAQENLTLQTFNTLGTGWTLFQGDDGITYEWLSGTTVPASSLGKNGDWYLNTATGYVYTKVSGSWQQKLNIVGPAGATPRGGWVNTTSYVTNDMVTYLGSTYIAARGNTGVTPGTSSADWTLYVSKGDTGATGQNGVTPSIGQNGNWWIGTTDTGVAAEISGSYITFNSVTSNQITLSGTETMPVAVLTNAGHLYPVEKGSITVDTVNDTFTLNVTPYLDYDNVPSFSGTWRLYLAAYAPASESAYTKAAADALFATQNNTYTKAAADALLAGKMSVRPAVIELNPANNTNGGLIDFHFAGSEADYTARIIESSIGHIDFVAPEGADIVTKNGDGDSYRIEVCCPIGSIILTPRSYVSGFLTCNGAAVSRTTYNKLFNRIGTAFGTGDGSTTFNLPDITSDITGTRYLIRY